MKDQQHGGPHQPLTERLRLQCALINLAHDAILVRDPQDRIISWNRGAEHLYGWPEQEVIGQVAHRLLATTFPQPRETIEHLLEQEGQWRGDLIQTDRNGRQVIVESRWAVIRDTQGAPAAILEINRDVTERRRLEQLELEARAEAKARLDVLQLILDELPTGALLVRGLQARLIFANRAAIELWGAEWKQDQSMEDFLTQHALRLFSEDGRPIPQFDTAIRHAMTEGVVTHKRQQVIRRPDGTSLPILVSAIPLDAFSTLPHLPSAMAAVQGSSERVVLVVYEDVTALKQAEEIKDQFISLATHELRTPLTVIAGYIDMILRRARQGKEHELDEWQRNKLQEVKRATQQLEQLTKDLLDVSRVQAGQFQLQLRPTELVALTRQVIERLQTTTKRHQLSLQTALPRLWATVDAFRIEQVLSNLLSNAIKYSPQGGAIEVTLEEEIETREARFSIRDYGMGISRDQQALIFGRFVRADNVRTARISGTGLGLYLCRELVERHGGRIYFESSEGRGTTFFFSLPCNAEQA
jgi:PAS domain S-box-containing protein